MTDQSPPHNIEAEQGLTAERLRRLLHYDPETGKWIWLVSRARGGRRGDEAGKVWEDYLKIRVGKRLYSAHRLAWLYMTGEWPPRVDHKDNDKLNCRWSNLRLATHSQNIANARMRSDNQLGMKGVNRTASGRYYARIALGTFDTAEEAAEAYRRAAIAIYGEFARGA